MDRKGIIALVLAVATLIAWTYFNGKDMQRQAAIRAKEQEVAAAKAKADEAAKAAEKPAVETTAAVATPAKPATPAEPEKKDTVQSESVEYTFTNLGGGISTALLKTHEAEHGKRMILNEFGNIPIGAMSEVAGEGVHAPFQAKVEGGKITFDRTDARQLEVTKTFTVPQATTLDKDYIVQLDVTFANHAKEPLNVPAYYIHTGASAPVHEKDSALYTGFKWQGGKLVDTMYFDKGWFHPERPVFTAAQPGIAWAGVANQYFTTLITAGQESGSNPPDAKDRGDAIWTTRFPIDNAAWEESGRANSNTEVKRYGVNGALQMPAFSLAPGETRVQHFSIYAGPREYGRLRLMPDGQADILGFSDVPGLFSFLGPFIGFFSRMLLFSLNTIHSWVGSYAVAIIILTLIIKSLLWPMQNKANRSMKRMQALQPKMNEIREKYKEDPARMNTEVMKLYKDYGVNPLGGCLPAFIQMPVFFGFYNMLGKAVELRNAKFLWVHDLSQPDTLFHLPGLGYPVNILPLCMAATMFWQMSASPKSGDPSQQKMFMIMPLIFIMFCYNYASALALYLTVQNLVSVVQLYATRNQAAPQLKKIK